MRCVLPRDQYIHWNKVLPTFAKLNAGTFDFNKRSCAMRAAYMHILDHSKDDYDSVFDQKFKEFCEGQKIKPPEFWHLK
jgi:hypothetical protein